MISKGGQLRKFFKLYFPFPPEVGIQTLNLFIQRLGAGKRQRHSIAMTKTSTKTTTRKRASRGVQIRNSTCLAIRERNMATGLISSATSRRDIDFIKSAFKVRDQTPGILSSRLLALVVRGNLTGDLKRNALAATRPDAHTCRGKTVTERIDGTGLVLFEFHPAVHDEAAENHHLKLHCFFPHFVFGVIEGPLEPDGTVRGDRDEVVVVLWETVSQAGNFVVVHSSLRNQVDIVLY